MHSTMMPITPGAIIGYRKNGSPIRLIAGGSPDEGDNGTGSAGSATGDASGQAQAGQPSGEPPAQQQDGSQPPAASQTGPASQQAGDGGGQQPPAQSAGTDEVPAWAQRELKKLRDEAAGNRVKAKDLAEKLAAKEAADAERMDKLAKAFGVKPEELTPEQIAEQAQAERDTSKAEAARLADAVRQSKVELAVYRNAAALEADGNALLDSRSFLSEVAGLDPAADDFAEQVKAAITKTVDAQPQYKLTPGQPAAPPKPAPPAVSKPSAEFSSPPPPARQLTEADVKRMSPSEVVDAMDKGLLSSLGFGRQRKHRR
jgi:hypothetical protein